jgi:GWxTD domain-containing protein
MDSFEGGEFRMKFSGKILLPCLLGMLLLLAVPSAAQNLYLQTNYATYKGPSDSVTYVEIYCSLYRYQLGFIPDEDSSLFAGVVISAQVLDPDGAPVDSASTYFVTRVEDEPEMNQPGFRLFDFLPLLLAPGEYRVLVSAYDRVSQNEGQALLSITVPAYCPDCLALSDLELAYNITPARNDNEGRLIKQGRKVVPNTTGTYIAGKDSALYVYAELYGLDTSSGSGTYTINCSVKDSVGQVLHNYGDTEHEKPGASAVLSKRLDVRYLPIGNYNLVLSVTDQETQQRTVASRQFTIASDQVFASSSTAAVGANDEVTEEDARIMVNIAYYHLSEAEKIQISNLTPVGKRNFLRQFWRDRDEDPTTPENEFYNTAVRRYIYANEHFSTSAEEDNGWKTDRGRVYITYGPWDERDEMYFAQGNFPFELWNYHNIQSGVLFVFVSDDKTAVNDYRLVHSTADGEVKDFEWEARLESGLPMEDF